MIPHRFHPEAEIEYSEAVLYYESSRLGLGFEFIQEIEKGIADILDVPEKWRVFDGDFRRILINRFPYAPILLPTMILNLRDGERVAGGKKVGQSAFS